MHAIIAAPATAARRTLAAAIALACAGGALAADTGQLACRSTEECAAQAARIGAAVSPPAATLTATSRRDQAEDQFYWLNKINKASVVMLVEEKILPRDTGRLIARGVAHTIEQATQPGGRRPSDVLQIEKIITDDIGPEGSLIHAGRSRQDMYATFRMARLRNQVLDDSEPVKI